jgi:ribonuclease HI
VAYTDGSGTIATRPCGAGVVIFDGDVAIIEASRYLGLGTNNRAELSAIGLALVITADAAHVEPYRQTPQDDGKLGLVSGRAPKGNHQS